MLRSEPKMPSLHLIESWAKELNLSPPEKVFQNKIRRAQSKKDIKFVAHLAASKKPRSEPKSEDPTPKDATKSPSAELLAAGIDIFTAHDHPESLSNTLRPVSRTFSWAKTPSALNKEPSSPLPISIKRFAPISSTSASNYQMVYRSRIKDHKLTINIRDDCSGASIFESKRNTRFGEVLEKRGRKRWEEVNGGGDLTPGEMRSSLVSKGDEHLRKAPRLGFHDMTACINKLIGYNHLDKISPEKSPSNILSTNENRSLGFNRKLSEVRMDNCIKVGDTLISFDRCSGKSKADSFLQRKAYSHSKRKTPKAEVAKMDSCSSGRLSVAAFRLNNIGSSIERRPSSRLSQMNSQPVTDRSQASMEANKASFCSTLKKDVFSNPITLQRHHLQRKIQMKTDTKTRSSINQPINQINDTLT